VHTRLVLSVLAAAPMLATVVQPASAQTTPAPHPFVIHGQVGLTFGGPTGALFGAGAGINLPAVPGLTIFGEFGKLTNVMNSELQDLVEDLVELEELEEFTDDFEFEVLLPTTYGFGGARYNVTPNAPVAVFVEGGVGFARVKAEVTLVIEGEDFSEAFGDFLEAQGATATTTEPLIVVGGGVMWPVTPTASIAAGLRINHIADSGGITKPSVYVGVVWRP